MKQPKKGLINGRYCSSGEKQTHLGKYRGDHVKKGPEPKPKKTRKNAGQIFLEELTAPAKPAGRKRRGQSLVIPALAIFSGLLVGAIIIILTTEEVYTAWSQSPLASLGAALRAVGNAYWSLFTGAFGDPVQIVQALQSGDAMAVRRAFNPFFESLVATTPYIFGGLAVALGFRTGLFNIGVEGQIFVGAIFATVAGYSIKGLPAIIHIPLALLAGALGGGLWGLIPGWLKAKTGGHEVINTIMMNYIAFRLSDWLLTGPMKRPDSFNPISPTIEESAWLPRFFESPIRFHLGFFIALGIAWLVYWFLFKTRWGFDLRTVGANPHAARYAGMNIVISTMLAMTLSGHYWLAGK
jgi:simple sugar transport system permease protein